FRDQVIVVGGDPGFGEVKSEDGYGTGPGELSAVPVRSNVCLMRLEASSGLGNSMNAQVLFQQRLVASHVIDSA
ncbi:MAG: hypothetical protein ACXW2I_16860, partial [Burkholderiales bacterium]